MKTIYRSTCALSGLPVRLVCDRDAYAVIVNGESIGCGFAFDRALSVYSSVASGSSPARSSAPSSAPVRQAPVSALKRASVRRFAAAFAAFALSLSVASVASAQEKVRKPTVCVNGETLESPKTRRVSFVCYDGKKPRMFASWTTVQFVDSDGKPARYTLGW